LGAFPLKTLSTVASGIAKKNIDVESVKTPGEGPTLQLLEGMTPDVVDLLEEVGLSSTQHLAYADPIKLFMRTNLPWKVTLDLVDQALLSNYVGAKVEQLRVFGIRGAIELGAVHEAIWNQVSSRLWPPTLLNASESTSPEC